MVTIKLRSWILVALVVTFVSARTESNAFTRSRWTIPEVSSKTTTDQPHVSTKTTAATSTLTGGPMVEPKNPTLASVRGGDILGMDNALLSSIAGALVMACFEKIVKFGFAKGDIKFPSQLGACIILFVSLLLTELVNPDLANSIFLALSPGAAFLAKWLPVFFVPGLAMLPLAPPIGSGMEVRITFIELEYYHDTKPILT